MFKLQIMRSGCNICSGGVKEGFHGSMHNAKHQRLATKQRIHMFFKQNVLSTVIFLIFAALAFYLSWSCNTKENVETMMKIVYGIFAALGNAVYVFWYFILRRKYCF